MSKRLKTVIPDSQQEITTRVEREEDELTINIRACGKLDEDLKTDFHDEAQELVTDEISVHSSTYRSNQGNEMGQDVTVRYDVEDSLDGIDIVGEVIDLGQHYYEQQLDRDLHGDHSERKREQDLREFDDPAIEEFCHLYYGKVALQE
ncbi:hypothetical protein GCM10028857_13380 [Salinarchaeum chitinilyticum]